MANDSDSIPTIDEQIDYHKEMEYNANKAGDFTKAQHHRKMQEIYEAMKEGKEENKK